MIVKTTAGKLSVLVFFISFIVLSLSIFVLFSVSNKTQEKIYLDIQNQLKNTTKFAFGAKSWIGTTNAIGLANNPSIQQALKENDRELANNFLKKYLADLKNNTIFTNIKVHIHTKDNHSFLRDWKPLKYGDDLSLFRETVVEVNRMKKPITSFEIGRGGLGLRAVVPIIDKDNNYLGSLEFIQELNSIAKFFKKERNSSFLLLMDIMSRSDNIESFESKKAFQQSYLISQEFIDQKFVDSASKIDLKKLLKDNQLYDDNYFYTYVDIKDFEGKHLGIALIGKSIKLVNYAIKDATNLIYLALTIMVFMTLTIALFIILASKKIIVYPINILEDGLNSFFSFLNKESEDIKKINEDISAEFGEMSKLINSNIAVVSQTLEKDKLFAKKLEEKNRKIKQLLDHANQGFLYFDKSMKIGGEHSIIAEEIFEKNIIGSKITELLYEEEIDQQLYVEESLIDILDMDSLRQELMLSLLETDFVINGKSIKIEYKILDNNSYMLILTDITEKIELDEKLKEEQQILKMVVEVAITLEQFTEIKDDYYQFISKIDSFKHINKLSELRRYIHTFKGLFAQKEMLNVVKELHSFEDIINKSLKQNIVLDELKNIKSDDMSKWLESDLDILKDILGEDYFVKSDFIYISKNRINSLFEKSKEHKEIANEIKQLSYHNIEIYFRPYQKMVAQLAKRFEKEIFPLKIESDEIYISNKYAPFLKSLVHIFRNSVDHGIELPEIREDIGKDYRGLITCNIYQKDKKLYIDISDDGMGIDIEKIKDKAIENNLISKEKIDAFSEEDIIMFIFKDEFSTATKVTDVSGRGVGLSALLSELYKLDGSVNIKNNFKNGIKFQFVLPFDMESNNA